jgi:hypothetical protein
VDGRPDLSLVIYTPATAQDAQLIRSLVNTPAAKKRGNGHIHRARDRSRSA